MNINKIYNRLEQLINSLTINENQKTFLRKKSNDLFDKLSYLSQSQGDYWPNILSQYNSNQFILKRFWYGGSFDRGIFIKNRFDIDMYFVFGVRTSPYFTPYNINQRKNYSNELSDLTGRKLFEVIYNNLRTYHNYYGINMKLLKDPPYGHAIPIRMDYPRISILFDCIPAIELSNGYLLIPNGIGGIKKVNPKLEEQALSKLNTKQNGKITKLILLMKYWNFTWGKPLKGYLIERLVESIFDKIKVNTWDRAVKTFFSRAIYILGRKKLIYDSVYTQYSILDEYSKSELEYFLEVLREAGTYAQDGEWEELFDEI